MAVKASSKWIRNVALQAKIFVIAIQIFFNYLIPDHDAKVFNPPSVHAANLADNVVDVLFGGLRRWDAVYFLHVAEHGYTYENTLAFFPLFPLLVRLTSDFVLFPLHFVMNYASVLLIAAVGLNLVFFVLSADVLYRLGIQVLGNERLARKAVQLYCVNPASIFFTAAYSESLYSLVTFYGMLSLEQNLVARSAVLFGASCLARSNGVINAAFILYAITRDASHRLGSVWTCAERGAEVRARVRSSLILAWFAFWRAVAHVLICAAPFLAYQWYASIVFCNPSARYSDLSAHIVEYGRERGYKMPSAAISVWCKQTIPFSYAHVQNTHWHVGLFQYYKLKQLPNFALALPMIVLCIYASGHYVSKNLRYCLTLGLGNGFVRGYKKTDDGPVDERRSELRQKSCFVYVVHMTYLVMFALLYMHIQVVTRLICSSCPVLYWFIAVKTTPPEQLVRRAPHAVAPHQNNGVPNNLAVENERDNNGGSVANDQQSDDPSNGDTVNWNYSTFNKFIIVYFQLYRFVGTAAFSNFLPWT